MSVLTRDVGHQLVAEQGLDIVIPDTYTSIGVRAFQHQELKSVVIPDSVISIGEDAFVGNKLTSITIGENVSTIESGVFAGNNLTSVVIPDSVISIGYNAFNNNQLTSIDIGNNVTTIGDYAFINNDLTSVVITDSITSIGSSAFERNELKSVVIGKSVTTIGNQAFYGNILLSSIDIGESVSTIGDYAFKDNQLTSIVIPDSVTSIGVGAFVGNELTSVSMGRNVTSIGYGAFGNSLGGEIFGYNNNKIKGSIVLDSVDSIAERAFFNNRLTSVEIGNSATSIGDYAFSSNQLTNAIIGNSVTSIGREAFNYNMLSSITIPDSVNTISENAFANNQLTSIAIGKNVSTIGSYAFVNNKSTSIVIPDSVISIGFSAFNNNQLTSIAIGKNVSTIGSYAFLGNKLTSIVIPDSVTSIDNSAFAHNKLTSITIGENVSTIESGVFAGNNLTSVVIPDSVISIRDSAFADNKLTSIVIPDSVTSIDHSAFAHNKLTSVVIPDSVSTIGDEVFAGNPLKHVSVSANLLFAPFDFPSGVVIDRRGIEQTPTDLSVSVSTFDENIVSGSAVATLRTSDPDAGDTHTYVLISGTGDTHNSAFTIDGNQLKINESPDYETQDFYTIRIKTKDSGGLTFEKSLTLSVNELNESPADIQVKYRDFDENISVGSGVTALSSTDEDSGDTHTYSLISGDGSEDNGSFEIVGNQLKINDSLNFETKESYSIRLQTKDSGGLTFEKVFTLNVNDLNDDPTDLLVSTSSFDENISAGSVVAELRSTDEDSGDTHTYSLSLGGGNADNSAFTIDGNQLKINESPDYETQDSYSVRLRTKDSGRLTFEKAFTLNVKDLNDDPTDLLVSTSSFDENISAGSVVAELSSTDEDSGDTHTYSLISGDGSEDNGSFEIVGDELKINDSPDFETKESYSVRLQTTDSAGLTFEKVFTLSVNDFNEVSTDIALSATTFDENIVDGSAVATLSTTDTDEGDTFTYLLVDGVGDIDNNAFTINGDELKIKDSPNFEAKSSYSIRLQTKDSGGLTFERAFTLSVNDLEEVPVIQSIEDVTIQKKVTTLKMKYSVAFADQILDTVIVGTNKKDKITGSSEGEVLAGGVGKDVLKGGAGADGFLFNQPDEYGKKKADKIKDFDSDEGDSILVDKDVFGLGKKIKLKVVTGKKASKKAAKSKNDFIYDDKKGLLYFNENGKDKGWGDGGLFVKLQGAPELGASDFTII